ncbi:MAG: carboxypeptidase regulatory-like domain-containing protein [Planctomycetes bacterium]|nr:carboxypeptidase regulatory-like domain-containing protein [Planctomycetota bacterium]
MAGLAGFFWLGMEERPSGRTLAPGAEAQLEPEGRAAELIPAAPPRTSTATPPAADAELEPFASARTSSTRPSGKQGSMRGHVTVSGEEPFPRVWRLVLRPSLLLPEREHALGRTLEFTDGREDFEVGELPLGGYDVFGEAEGFNGQALSVLLEPGSEHPFLNLRMVPAGRLEGRILDARGLAAEGIPVTLFAVEGAAREAVSDAFGVFLFEKLPDGAYELLVGKETAPLLPERHPVRFLAPRLTFPDITLPALGEIHVRVVDSFERPLEGVDVRGSGNNGGAFEGKTDYDGRLHAKHLPGGTFRIRLQHPGFEEQYARRISVLVGPGLVSEAPVRLGP